MPHGKLKIVFTCEWKVTKMVFVLFPGTAMKLTDGYQEQPTGWLFHRPHCQMVSRILLGKILHHVWQMEPKRPCK